MLHDEFGEQGYTIPHHEAKYCFVRFFGYFRADAAKIADMWGYENNHNNQRSKQILGIEYISAQDSFREMIPTMIKQGILEDKRPSAQS